LFRFVFAFLLFFTRIHFCICILEGTTTDIRLYLTV
jgi:hypothetical protein